MRNKLLLTLSVLIMAALGCGSGDDVKLYDYSGTIKFDGQPIPFGMIVFLADVSKGNEGPRGVAEIVDGKFDTSSEHGRGCIGGPTILKITAYREEPPKEISDEVEELPPVDTICIAFPMEKDLPQETSTLDLEVPIDALGYDDNKSSNPQFVP